MKHFSSGNKIRSLREYLDTLDVPVVVVDDDVRVITANEQAQLLFGKKLPVIEGSYGGEMAECAYARLPGGCGKTVHCRSCAIRNTVTDTYRTSKNHVRVPAYEDRPAGETQKKIRFLISTEKVGEFVLLKIDNVGPPDR